MIESKATEHFDFGADGFEPVTSSRKRNIKTELANKGFDPERIIDAYEQAKGIKKRSDATDIADYEIKNIILDPEQQRDQDMLNELMNNKKYLIIMWKDTWTTQGSFRVFIIYGSKKEKDSTKK